MGFAEELEKEVAGIFKESWSKRDGTVIPDTDSLALNNNAVNLTETSVLYADMAESTELVNTKTPHFAAEVYKAFLVCCARIIRKNDGQITAYDGDRIMAIFDRYEHRSDAAKTALQINYAVKKIINPAIKSQYPDSTYELKHAVGIDSSDLFVAKIGIRNNNDLVWVGRAANYAAKLCELRDDTYPSWITDTVYDRLNNDSKLAKGVNMWKEMVWNARGKHRIYCSSYWWPV